MKKDVTEYVSKCLTCQQIKAKHQVPIGMLNPLPIPQWKYDNITMDFVSGFPLTQQKHDSVWVIVDKITKSAHFIPVKMDYSMDRLAKLYVKENVRLHGVPLSIMSDSGQTKLYDVLSVCQISGTATQELLSPRQWHQKLVQTKLYDVNNVCKLLVLPLKNFLVPGNGTKNLLRPNCMM